MKRGFTLIEMLVVIGIIAILVGASIGGFSAMTKAAEKAKTQELVSNTATALTALFQQNGMWPKRLIENNNKQLDENAAYVLVAGTTKYLSLTAKDGKLVGLDRCGVVTPAATAALKRAGTSGNKDTPVGTAKVKDHILYYALDLDGDGIVNGADVGGVSVDIRATAAVWCCGKDGVISPYPYAGGGGNKVKGAQEKKAGARSDDVYSWTPGQTRSIQ